MRTKAKIKIAFGVVAFWACFIFIIPSANAQKEYSNSIQLSFTDFVYPGLQPADVPSQLANIPVNISQQLGLYYKRKLYKNWSVVTGYNMFNTLMNSGNYSPLTDGGPSVRGEKASEPMHVGSIFWRYNYKMFDVFFMYKLKAYRKHKISMGIGSSYYWGENAVIDGISSGSGVGQFYLSNYHASYWGLVPAITYDYVCFRNRLSVGIDLRYRKYFGLPSEQIDYGAHIGFNF